MPSSPYILTDAEISAWLPQLDVLDVLEQAFLALSQGLAVQPAQSLTLFPKSQGDFIAYLGVLGHVRTFGVKLSPYIPNPEGPLVTAWTLLLSMDSGQALLLCDAKRLTTERTAATSALAIHKLARPESAVLALFGSGPIAMAHLRYTLPLRPWTDIRVYSPQLAFKKDRQQQFRELDPRISFPKTASQCALEADVVMLATASPTPVIRPEDISPRSLLTSISTNAPRAHEIPPEMLSQMDVYCDDKTGTPFSAGEMLLAEEKNIWSKDRIMGDLAELCAQTCSLPQYERPVYFRSIGLGIEDIAIAHALYEYRLRQ